MQRDCYRHFHQRLSHISRFTLSCHEYQSTQVRCPFTSLYHSAEAGDYGDRSYPGNCGGNLIKDLLRYFQPDTVFDP